MTIQTAPNTITKQYRAKKNLAYCYGVEFFNSNEVFTDEEGNEYGLTIL